MRRSICELLCVAVVGACLSAPASLFAEDPAPAQKSEQPSMKPTAPPAKVQPVSPMANKQSDTVANPAPGAVKPATVAQPGKPASDIPEPTVQLKEGEVPAVKFDTPTYDFGRIRAGQEIVHDFWFSNTGTGPLEILKVRPSCGCTTAGQHDRIVQPGQSGKIPIRMNVGNASGPIHKTVMINTNCAGEGAAVTLHIQGEVWQPIQATPTSASFGRLTTDMVTNSSMERRLTIVNNTEEKVEITEAKSSNPAFTAEIAVLEEGKKYELVVKLASQPATGPVTGNIDLTTTLSDMPKMQIPVNAYVTADVDVTPNQLTLPAVRNGDIQRQFFVRNNTVNPVKLSDLTSTNEMLKLSVVETQPVGKAYRLTVDIPADYQVSEGGDRIIVKTDNPSVPELAIPISQAPTMADVNKQFSVQPGQVSPAAVAPAEHKHDHAQDGHDHAHPHAQPAAPATGSGNK